MNQIKLVDESKPEETKLLDDVLTEDDDEEDGDREFDLAY
jgi:hypothetical protein